MDPVEELTRIRAAVRTIEDSLPPDELRHRLGLRQRQCVRVLRAHPHLAPAGWEPGAASADELLAWQRLYDLLAALYPSVPQPAEYADGAVPREGGGVVWLTRPEGAGRWIDATLSALNCIIANATAAPRTGRLWFDDDGALCQNGPVSLSRYLEALSDQLKRFLTRLETCERNAAGDYLPSDSHAGPLRGLEVLWSNVGLLAGGAFTLTLTPPPDEVLKSLKPDEARPVKLTPFRNAQPLADLLKQLQFAILWRSNDKWADHIPAPTVAKLHALARELDEYRRESTCESDADSPDDCDTATPAAFDPPEGTHRGGCRYSPRDDWTLPTAVAWFLEAWEPAARLRPPLTSDPNRVPLAEKPPKLHELWGEVYERYRCLNKWLHEGWYGGAGPEPVDVADRKAVAAQIDKHRLLHAASMRGDGILTADHAAQIEDATNYLRGKSATARPSVNPSPKQKKKRATFKSGPRPLSALENRTLQVVGKHCGNFTAAARELGRNPKTVRENYERAMAKTAAITRSVASGRLPTDRRGQAAVSRDDEDE